MDKSFSELVLLPEFSFPVYISPGGEQRAGEIGTRCERARHFLSTLFKARVDMTLLVLSPADWSSYALFPLYGWPHFTDEHTIVAAGEHNGYWRRVAPFAETLPPPMDQTFRDTYSQPDGPPDLSHFFEFFPVHEMAHLFHYQAGFEFPRRWLMELFCNLAMHTYLATEEPHQLTSLTTFPQLVVDVGHAHYAHHSLDDFERLYEEVAPENYGWYQCQFLVAARQIYDSGGEEVLQRLWKTFLREREPLSEEELATRLREDVHPEVERVFRTWPQ